METESKAVFQVAVEQKKTKNKIKDLKSFEES